jgi:HNH endonuclease
MERLKVKNELTAERLRELLHFDPETGIFTWLVRTNRRIKMGSVAGCVNDKGYIVIRIDRRDYLALAFLWMTGAWPMNEGDHENRVRHDNRWSNLRNATHSQNMANQSIHSVSLLPSAKYLAQITINRKTNFLGTFDTSDEASAAYQAAAQEAFGAFAANDNNGDFARTA